MNISKAVKWILIINIITFVITMFSPTILMLLSIYPYGSGFMPWQPITYQFVHSGIMHILFNMLFLAMIGPMIEEQYFRTAKRFTLFYLGCGIGTGLLSNIFNSNAIILGASGSLFGLLVPLWVAFREQEIMFFGLIKMKMKTLIYIIVGIQFLLFLSQGNPSALGHLFGILFGIIIIYFYGNGIFAKKQKQTDQSDFI